MFRSSASERELGRRRVLALTTVVGLSGVCAVGGLLVGLVPADAGQTVRPETTVPSGPAQGEANLPQEAPVATSGAS